MKAVSKGELAFSLVEVVLAIGVIAFAIVAILGTLPIALQSGHAGQDETRAAHIAQDVIVAMTSQAPSNFSAVKIPLEGNTISQAIDLTTSTTATSTPALKLYATNDGHLSSSASGAAYSVAVATNSSPAGFDAGYANLVTVRVGWPAAATAGNQTTRDYMQIVSKY